MASSINTSVVIPVDLHNRAKRIFAVTGDSLSGFLSKQLEAFVVRAESVLGEELDEVQKLEAAAAERKKKMLDRLSAGGSSPNGSDG